MSVRRFAVVALGVLAGGLGFAASAAAAPAEVNLSRECTTTEFGTFCMASHTVINTTETPSGLLSIATLAKFHFSSSSPGCESESESISSQHFLVRLEGPDDEVHVTMRESSSVDCGPNRFECTGEWLLTYANGEFRVNRRSQECVPA